MSHHEDENPIDRPNQRTGSVETGQEDLDIAISNRCLEIVEQYKRGDFDKLGAVVELQNTIPRDSPTDRTYLAAFASYFKRLEAWDTYRQSADTAHSHEFYSPKNL
jgi:hypothetical protein